MIDMKEKIIQRLEEYQKQLLIWNNEIEKLTKGEIPMMRPYVDLVIRNSSMYANKIEELNWILELLDEESKDYDDVSWGTHLSREY
jgi:hypothetical protein